MTWWIVPLSLSCVFVRVALLGYLLMSQNRSNYSDPADAEDITK